MEDYEKLFEPRIKNYDKSKESMTIDKKEKIIQDAKSIIKKNKNISIKQALALAGATFMLGVPAGYAIGHSSVSSNNDKAIVIEESKGKIKSGEILDGQIEKSLKSFSKVAVMLEEEKVGSVDRDDVELYRPFKNAEKLNFRESPNSNEPDEILISLEPNEILYVNTDGQIETEDGFIWEKAIYEKDDVTYEGYVANFCLQEIIGKNELRIRVKNDTNIEFSSEKAKKLFEGRKIRNIKKKREENVTENSETVQEGTQWEQYSEEINVYENPVYNMLEDENADKPIEYGYEEIEITDEDVEKLVKFTYSWENPALYNYLSGVSNDYNNIYVSSCITADRKNYICYIDGLGYYGDNSARNYGFGVNISQNNIDGIREKNWGHVEVLENKYGYDLNDENLLKPGVSTMPVECIDEATSNFLKQRINEVKECIKAQNIKFSKHEILALAAISYQCGAERIPNMIENYARWGNTKELRRNFEWSGYNPFEYASGAQISYNNVEIGRNYAYWKAFHDGKFIMASGPEEIIDINSSNINQNQFSSENER